MIKFIFKQNKKGKIWSLSENAGFGKVKMSGFELQIEIIQEKMIMP
jgi:hypothetical protein